MKWTKEDSQLLLSFKDSVDNDDVKVKEIIKKVLLKNKYIIRVLENKELEEADAEPEDYFDVNILPYYLIQPTQHHLNNYICYEVSYKDLDRYNSSVKMLQIVFYILCEENNIKDRDTGVSKHDLLAALIQDQFNFTNYFGSKIKLVSDVPGAVDNNYASRTLTFVQETDNNLIKTRNGQSRFFNKDVITLEES